MEKPFACVAPLSAPESLRSAVRARVERAQRRVFVSRLILSVAVEAVSIIAVVASFSYIAQSLEASGTFSYLRLIMSEGFGLIGYSKELLLSLVESLPVLALAALFAAVLSFGWSTLRLVRRSRFVASYA